MPAEAKKRVRAQLKQPGEVKTVWERLEDDDLVDPPVDVTGVVYPKKPKPIKHVGAYDLPRLPTRVLLQYLASARACGDNFDPCYDGNGPGIPVEAIKAELAKRPHVPSKREGSELRRKKVLGKKKAAQKAAEERRIRDHRPR
jgi:hypothetical protein